MTIEFPDPFLEVRVQNLAEVPPVSGLCAGYESGAWRATALGSYLFNWLPFIALSREHQSEFSSKTFVELLEIACAHVYNTGKTTSRGELGEILLHLASISHFNTLPVLCKLVLKTSSNDTVKGFDGIHVLLKSDDDFEIWLGESKFYRDPNAAIRDAVGSVKDHILPEFLATEKAMIFGHIGRDAPKRDELLRVFRRQTSSDELLRRAVFPVLIAYESRSAQNFTEICDGYVESLKVELAGLREYFAEKAEGLSLRFHLIFVPMISKQDVVDSFDRKLAAFL